MNCEELRCAVAAPAEPSELKDGIVFLGLGHPHEHRARARPHARPWRVDSGLPVHDAAIATARTAALHRLQA
eukprot:2583705-Pyramimonas_sp.AAC.1